MCVYIYIYIYIFIPDYGKRDSVHHDLLGVISETATVPEFRQQLLYITPSGWWYVAGGNWKHLVPSVSPGDVWRSMQLELAVKHFGSSGTWCLRMWGSKPIVVDPQKLKVWGLHT